MPERRRRRSWAGATFSSPWILGFLIFSLGPMLASLYFSFTDANLFNDASWTGLANYVAVFHDERVFHALWNTAYLTVIGVPLGLFLALVVALALNLPVRGLPLYRAVAYLPAIVPVVTVTYLWRWILNSQYGYLNQFLAFVGLPQPNWLENPMWTKPAVVLLSLWGVGATAVIYLAALQGVPKQYYEAAAVDGANAWHRFWHVTWPALTPVTLFQLIMGVIGSLQIFSQPYLLVQTRSNGASGGPDDSLLTFTMYIFQSAFVFLKMGYASALSWILFLAIGALTVALVISSRKWVSYDME